MFAHSHPPRGTHAKSLIYQLKKHASINLRKTVSKNTTSQNRFEKHNLSPSSSSISHPVPIFKKQSELEEHEKTTSKLAPTKARISKRNKSSAEPPKPTLERKFANQE
ncbi:hypothetical protein PIB30_092335, partial [Stylosanthes scabra]|nr:hypothetical protein [Stylosanthes scabra]